MRQDLHPEDRALMMSGLSDAEALSEGLIDYFDLPFQEYKTPEEIEAERQAQDEEDRRREEQEYRLSRLNPGKPPIEIDF